MGTNTPIEEMQDLRRSRVKETDYRMSFSGGDPSDE
jgi:hypothetical protein